VLLALARPIGWGYAALAVTLLHMVVVGAVVGFEGSEFVASDPQVFFLSFVANVLLVAGISFIRTKAKPGALGGAFVTCGLAVLGWLFLPMASGNGHEPGFEEVHPMTELGDPDAHEREGRPPRHEFEPRGFGRRVRLMPIQHVEPRHEEHRRFRPRE
jgi:hypothetical protein